MNDIIDLVNSAKPGDVIHVTILRGGSTKTLSLTLGDRPSSVR